MPGPQTQLLLLLLLRIPQGPEPAETMIRCRYDLCRYLNPRAVAVLSRVLARSKLLPRRRLHASL